MKILHSNLIGNSERDLLIIHGFLGMGDNWKTHAKKIADIFYKEGYKEVEAKSGVHSGTYKVFVNFIPIADVTQLDYQLFNNLHKKCIKLECYLTYKIVLEEGTKEKKTKIFLKKRAKLIKEDELWLISNVVDIKAAYELEEDIKINK